MATKIGCFLSTLTLLCMISNVAPYKILLMPFDHKGHVNFFSVTAQALQQEGHEVLVLAQKRHKEMLDKKGVPYLLNPTEKSHSLAEDYNKISEMFFSTGFQHMINTMKTVDSLVNATVSYCYEVMQNKRIMQQLEENRFDITLVDGSDFCRCFLILPYRLNTKFISISVRHDPWYSKVPAMPSIEGIMPFYIMPENPPFSTRLFNFLAYILLSFMMPPSIFKDHQISDLAPNMPPITYKELFFKSELFMLNFDNYCSDYPRLSAPFYQFIGGMAAHPPKPLDGEFEKIFDKADHGVIIVSFGSLLERPPKEMMDKLFAVFHRVPQQVIMRYNGTVDNIPPNVKLSKWLPQNDLLGHPKTRLFVAHGGNNGQMEGLYHGVPMIVMPFGADQQYNGFRVADKKFGIHLHPFNFKIDEMIKAVTEIIENPEYSYNIKKCSSIIKSFPSPHEKINFWVDHVMRFGGDHLKPKNMDMPLWKFFMLDVLLLLLVVNVIIVFCAYKCCTKCYMRCCRNEQKAKKE